LRGVPGSYDDTLCSLDKYSLTVLFILLSLSAKLGLRRKAADIKAAYLHARLKNPEYMRLSKSIAKIIVEDDKDKAEWDHGGRADKSAVRSSIVGTFRSLLMKVMYLALRTRPDILLHTVVLSSRQKAPTVTDWGKLMRLVEYIKGTREQGITFKSTGELDLHAYTDAAFSCHQDCRSHTGYCIRVDRTNSASVLNRSVKQKSLADSSTEAEIIALHEGVRHLLWVLDIYSSLGYRPECAVEVYQDNLAAIQLTKDVPVNFKGNSKFISRKYFTVHEHLENGRIQLIHVGTHDMIADFFTKAIMGAKRMKFKVQIMGMDEDGEEGIGH